MREREINKQKADSRHSGSPTRNKDTSLKLCFLLGITIFAQSEMSIWKLKRSAVSHFDPIIIFKSTTFYVTVTAIIPNWVTFFFKNHFCCVRVLCGNTCNQQHHFFPTNRDPGKICNIVKIVVLGIGALKSGPGSP